GNRRGEHRIVAEDARGVAFAGRVLDQAGVAGAEDVLGAVAQPDLELAGQDDHELAPRRRMPVDELTARPLAERDLRGRYSLGGIVRSRSLNWSSHSPSMRQRT